MSVIFFFSSLPGSPDIFDPPFFYYVERKGAHIVEYMVLFLLAVRFFAGVFPREIVPRIIALAFVFSSAYGASDELHQFFTPYRGPKMTDVIIDVCGVLIMAGLYYTFYRIKNASNKRKIEI